MTHALAATAASTPHPAVQAITPTVLVDGVPDPTLHVLRYAASLPMDARRAVLAIDPSADAPLRATHTTPGQAITLAVPHPQADGSVRWEVLLTGVAQQSDRERAAGTEHATLIVRDDLTRLLEAPADTLGLDPDQAQTLESALSRLASLIPAELVCACDPERLGMQIEFTPTTPPTLAALLAPAIDRAGLRLSQSLTLERDRVRRCLSVMPARVGRPIALPWPDDQGRGGMVLRVDADADRTPPRRWIALGARPVVEDTFPLLPGWDPALAGQPDADYARLTSTDFSRFGSVFRAWVLNEDGAFTPPPFNQGPAFDVGALFDAPGSVSRPLRLGDCLARDASGRPIAPVVESSTDSGATWSPCPGQAEVMPDRAGVLLTDDTLPGGILAAAQAGTLRLRVTASLTGPDRITHQRWDGNPFAGAGPTAKLRLGDRYAWRRVLPTSRHASAITAGQLTADTADDRAALARTLADHLARSLGASASATVELAGAWTAVRVGDTVHGLQAPGFGIDGTPTVFNARPARVHELRIDFGVTNHTPRTRLRLD